MKSLPGLLITGAAILAAITLSSCSTSKGFGRDLQKLGSEIEQEANEHQR
jgi:predicted small secreted protein